MCIVPIIDQRGDLRSKTLLSRLESRSKMDLREVNVRVEEILSDVKQRGDQAVLDYTLRFDQVDLKGSYRISKEEMDQALETLDPALKDALYAAQKNIKSFHEAQMDTIKDTVLDDGHGKRTMLVHRPLSSVGIYVPGGTAALPSSVLMNAIPAKAAAVDRIVMCTPPTKEGKIADVILAAASMAGVDELYMVGGAQAIALLAYGTETVQAVDKITGPGNIYVNAAKRQVFGTVDIDMFAGPSEVLILADETADPEFVAADMLAQAEHDVLASSVAITPSMELAKKIQASVDEQTKLRPRRSIIEEALSEYGAIVVVDDLDIAVEFANQIAPEHLELCMDETLAHSLLAKISHAGAIFIGAYSPEPLGDYYAGPNHVLPTSGTAKFSSPLNCMDFLKKQSIIEYSKEALLSVASDIVLLAEAEGLDAHAEAIRLRVKKAGESND